MINNIIDQYKITKMREHGSNNIVITESMKGANYKKCNNCETFNKLEINGQYVCIECTPEYKKLYEAE